MRIISVNGKKPIADTTQSINGKDVVSGNLRKLAKLLESQQENVKLVLWNPYPPGQYRFYRSKGDPETRVSVSSRLNPNSMIASYLQDGQKVDLLLTQEWIDDVDKQKRKSNRLDDSALDTTALRWPLV
eukprot:TRINITY_DN2045_c0_g1_i1.p1 TRINITY_DN2045_c0_g1~~TRINITY_DN2045_c0_g1_i1.p1  ORF type:complete len:129 (-),score=30.24 TRINITY_DN2045_c0_g1_i1:26-412(-)